MRPGKPADRLFRELSYPFEPHHYSLRHHHLNIGKEMADSKYLYDYLVIKAWKIQIRSLIDPPYFFKFEVGTAKGGGPPLLHVHLIADIDAGLLGIPRTSKSEVIKPITDLADFRRRLLYLFKPGVERSPEAVAEYLEAIERIREENIGLPKSKQRKQLPQISGYVWD
jgi:hypothetical protein